MYVIAKKPYDNQVTARLVSVKNFELNNKVLPWRLLMKWMKKTNEDVLELPNLLDWVYYKWQLANVVLEIVSIPAAMQCVDNPFRNINYRLWLLKWVREIKDKRKQMTMVSFLKTTFKGTQPQAFRFKSPKDSTVLMNDREKKSTEYT